MANDYYDEEGCLVCGTCGARKTTSIVHRQLTENPKAARLFGSIALKPCIPCMCRCQESALDEHERARKQADTVRNADSRRSSALLSPAMAKHRFTADDNRNPALKRRMERFAESFTDEGNGLMLYGSTGTGKTFYAACIANALIDQGMAVQMVSLPELVALKEREGFKRDVYGELSKPDLIIFDDLGTERKTGYMDEQVFVAIDTRYRSGKPFLVTTNLDPMSLEAMAKKDTQAARIWRRIGERCYPVHVVEPSEFPRQEAIL